MKIKFDFNNYHFYNFPRRLSELDYREVCDLAVSRSQNNPNIESIYLVGGKWMPGISDIDILFVLKDKVSPKIRFILPAELSSKAKFIFVHGCGTSDIESFKNYFYLVPEKTKLKLIHGNPIEVRQPKKELSPLDYKFLQAIIVFDLLINKLLYFPRYLKYSELDVRDLIGQIYSITYTLEMIEEITEKKIATDFSFKINQLRRKWFDENKNNNLKKILELSGESIDLILDIVILLNQFLNEKLEKKDKDALKTNAVFKTPKHHIVFKSSENWNKQVFLEELYRHYKKIKFPLFSKEMEVFRMTLPLNLLYFLVSYANFDGKMSEWFRASLNEKIRIDHFNEGIKSHIEATNYLVGASVKNYGLIRIPFSYGFLVNENKIKYILKRVMIFFNRL